MKIFIFKDTNLDEGLLFSDNKTTASKLSEINSMMKWLLCFLMKCLATDTSVMLTSILKR